jgi:hypothetical protein
MISSPEGYTNVPRLRRSEAKKKSARILIRWLLSTGWSPEFRPAERYRAEADQEYQEWAEAAARQRLAGVSPASASSLPVSPG